MTVADLIDQIEALGRPEDTVDVILRRHENEFDQELVIAGVLRMTDHSAGNPTAKVVLIVRPIHVGEWRRQQEEKKSD